MTVINVVLDPLLAYGWGPIPAFGVVGIACATIALYVLAGAYIWIRILRSDLGKLYSLSRSSFRGRLSRSLAVFSVRSALDQLLLAATVALVIGFTAIAGDEAVAGYTAGSRVEQFIVLVVLGLNVGAIVVAARLLGARDYTRLSELFRLLLALAVIVGAVGMFILLALASQISSLMLESEPIASLTTTYLRIAAIGLPAQCTAIVCGGLLVGLQHMKLALRLNIIRLILVPLLVVGVTVVAIDTSASTIWWSYVGSIWATAGLLVARTKQVLSVVVLSGPTS